MRNIRKGREPKAWEEHRCQAHSNFDNCPPDAKQELRLKLSSEQGAICCYCLQRILPTRERMKVEHWQCQHLYPEMQLTYANLLGACTGGEGQPYEFQHCDTRKGNQTLSKNPANLTHDVERTIHYLSNGLIHSSDPQFNTELNTVLNLNAPGLINYRKAVLDVFKISMTKSGGWSRPILTKKLAEWRGDGGELKPFCQVVVYYLEKRLARGDL
jgi:uncharacterized protein (TIGR02646 family)